MINENEISTIELYQVYTCRNLKKRIFEYFKSHNINFDETTQKDWQDATNYVMKLRDEGVLSKYFETVPEFIYIREVIE